jgi:hypothetical protein
MKPFKGVSYLSIMLCLALIVAFACNKQTDFGADLLGNDVIPLKFDDTLSLQVINTSVDSVPTFDIASASSDNILMAGNLQDPLFGKVKSDAYLVFQPDRIIEDFDTTGLVFDSLVFSLSVDPNIFYGDTLIPMNINIERISENMFTDSVIYSTRSLATSGSIGSISNLQFTPKKTTEVIDSSAGVKDTTQVPFFIRTRLSDALGLELFNADVYDSIPKFTDLFKGVKISVENESSLLAIDVSGSRTRMVIHYHDTIPRTIVLVVNPSTRRFSHFEMDHSQSTAGQYKNSLEKGDEYMTLQGLAGLRPKIIFPNLDKYKGRGIKFVQLEMTVAADISGNPGPNFREVDQMAASGVNTAGTLTLIEDFTSLFTRNQLNLFGGSPRIDLVDGVKVKRYTINMTQHFIRMLKGDETNEVMLSVLGGSRRANRVILYGPGHSTYPLRLKIAYSDL